MRTHGFVEHTVVYFNEHGDLLSQTADCDSCQSQSPTSHRASTSMYSSEYKHVLANISGSPCYDAIATQPVHRLQIRQIVHN